MNKLLLIVFLFLNFFLLRAQNEDNHGIFYLSGGVVFSKAYTPEIFSSVEEENSFLKWQHNSVSRSTHFFGSLSFDSKYFPFSSKMSGHQNWFWQFGFSVLRYSTSLDHFISNYRIEENGNSQLLSSQPQFSYESQSNNTAGQLNFSISKNFRNSFFIQLALGYRLDYSFNEKIENLNPENIVWNLGYFSSSQINTARYNHDIVLALQPYFNISEFLVLGIFTNLPLSPFKSILNSNKVPIPGSHSNFLLNSIFTGISLGYRLNNASQGCGSCP